MKQVFPPRVPSGRQFVAHADSHRVVGVQFGGSRPGDRRFLGREQRVSDVHHRQGAVRLTPGVFRTMVKRDGNKLAGPHCARAGRFGFSLSFRPPFQLE